MESTTTAVAAVAAAATAKATITTTSSLVPLLPVVLQCPDYGNDKNNHNPLPPLAAADSRHHTFLYQKESSHLISSFNVSEYLQTFREREFDGWRHTYNQVKQGMYDWKAKHFAELLHLDNDNTTTTTKTIYESACGIGLNLYLTLEILLESAATAAANVSTTREAKKLLPQIIVYGNEYQADSTRLARKITAHESFPAMSGTICQGDSSNHSFVPSDTFDLVYTGYLSPLSDPLRLADQYHIESDQDLYRRYVEYCESKQNGTDNADAGNGGGQADRAQQIQQDWIAQWVGEMIRIAAPGSKIIVEQLAYPLCQDPTDWGGVNQDFWKPAISKYKWQVDPESIEFQEDTIFQLRYHMAMRKLKLK